MKTVVDGLEMFQTSDKLVAMECDSCGTVHPNRTNVRNDVEWPLIAAADGWTFTGNGRRGEKHYCPKCSESP